MPERIVGWTETHLLRLKRKDRGKGQRLGEIGIREAQTSIKP